MPTPTPVTRPPRLVRKRDGSLQPFDAAKIERHAGLFPFGELRALAPTLASAGVTRWVLQRCRVGGATAPGPDAAELALLREAFPGTAQPG